MFRPIPAKVVYPSASYYAGVCQGVLEPDPTLGLYVPYYVEQAGYSDNSVIECRCPLVMVDVFDPGLSSDPAETLELPFVVDTGSPITIIYRNMLATRKSNAFGGWPQKTVNVLGITDNPNQGKEYYCFPAYLSIPVPSYPSVALPLGDVILAIDEDTEEDRGILGMDILSRIATTYSETTVTFWKRSHSGPPLV